MRELELFYKRIRAVLMLRLEDRAYDEWLRSTHGDKCFYAGKTHGPCSGAHVLDHVLGGYQGGKASGLLKIVSCMYHNQLAEQKRAMHLDALQDAIILRLLYDQHKLTKR